MTRYALKIEYDGTSLAGWQEQKNAPSVQGLIQDAIEKFCFERTVVYAAGRTDAGVHARAMVAHVDIEKPTDAETIKSAVNFYLNKQPVILLDVVCVPDEFHARFAAKYRRYSYHILNRRSPAVLERDRVWWIPREINVDNMRIAACDLLGNHDFTSFRSSECQAKSPIKTMDKIEVDSVGDKIIINFGAISFLHHQVRNMVGTLVEIGLGKMDVNAIPGILSACDRRVAGPTAPASGLYFESVDYSDAIFDSNK